MMVLINSLITVLMITLGDKSSQRDGIN